MTAPIIKEAQFSDDVTYTSVSTTESITMTFTVDVNKATKQERAEAMLEFSAAMYGMSLNIAHLIDPNYLPEDPPTT